MRAWLIRWKWRALDTAARLPVLWRWPYGERWQPRWTDEWPSRYPRLIEARGPSKWPRLLANTAWAIAGLLAAGVMAYFFTEFIYKVASL